MGNNVTISFSGVDGVGKSTQIMMLKQYFEENGITYRILYARTMNTKICRLLLKKITSSPTNLNMIIYKAISYIIYIYFFGILKNAKMNNQILLMDRTLIDSVVDEAMALKSELTRPISFLGRKRSKEIRIYMNADIENIKKRFEKRGEQFNYEYTKTQLGLYKRLIELNDDQYVQIDANRDEISIFNDVLNVLRAGELQ